MVAILFFHMTAWPDSCGRDAYSEN